MFLISYGNLGRGGSAGRSAKRTEDGGASGQHEERYENKVEAMFPLMLLSSLANTEQVPGDFGNPVPMRD